MYASSSEKRRGIDSFADVDRSRCLLCGWDKAECDRHRIIPGEKGGKYEENNIISVCPNCHRLLHRGLLELNDIKVTIAPIL